MSDIAVRARQTDSTAATVELPRYFAVSAAALAVDAGLLWLLTQAFGMPYLAANAVGLFADIGIGGLLVNEVVLWLGVEAAAASLLYAKAVAAGTSFAFNFLVRKYLLFT